MNPNEVADEMRRMSGLLDKAITAVREQSVEYADAENQYRMAHAKAYLAYEGPAHARKAAADLATGDERYRAHLADGMRQAALEAVRSRRAQISALQSLLSAHREEAAFARTGPQ